VATRRRLTATLLVAAAVLLPSPPAAAAPTLRAENLPAGFPVGQRQYVAGTAEFKAARWSTACKSGGPSAGANTDPRTGVPNAAGRARGVDVGMWLEAATPSLPLLAWWTESEEKRIDWWKTVSAVGGDYPGDAVAAHKSPPLEALPKAPAMYFGGVPQYPIGYCSAELARWTDPANTQTGFRWAKQLDRVTLADMKRRGSDASPAQTTPCAQEIDGGSWCSMAYYVDCTRAHGTDERAACTHWNEVMAEEIYEGYHWSRDHRSTWHKFTSFMGGMFYDGAVGALAFANGVADFFAGIYHAIKKFVDFIANASTAFDKLVNELKQDAVGLVTNVLRNYNHGSSWDVRRGGFLERYALMAALGIVLAAFMFIGALRRAVDRGDRDELKRTVIRLIKTVVIILWAPALFQLVATTGTKATADVVSHWTGGAAGDAMNKLRGVNSVTDSIPGGAFMGFILFLLMFLGALGLWVGLMAQRYGMELGATLIPFVAGAYVHPRWKRKVNRALWVVIGLILAKPVTMIVLGAAFGVINEGLSFSGSTTEVLAGMTLATIGIVTTGLAPFAALKWAPVLPTSEDSHDHHRGAGAAMSGVVLGAAGAALASRAGSMRRSGPRQGTPTNHSEATAGGGALTQAYDNGLVGRGRPTARPATGRVNGSVRGAASRLGRTAGAGAIAGAALGAQAAQSGITRGRALADHQTPHVDLPDDEE
jgi:hypothetical protein